MNDLESWLDRHGLGKYARAFVDNEIELGELSELTEADLRELGLPMGPRRRFLKAVREADGARAGDVSPSGEGHREEEAAAGRAEAAQEAERRQLTIMFADLVGSTELAQRVDPEDLRQINRRYQDLARESVESFGGFVARYMGDGVLAYFGFPNAHEDDPERAIRAGLDLVSELGRTAELASLSVRVGIATGPVVVGDLIGEGASQESAVVGETPNLAARLQALAAPDTVVVSETTRRVVGGAFSFEALSARDLKGFSAPVVPYRVEGEAVGQSRFAARSGRSLSAFVGREEEVELLGRRWERAREGAGAVVVLVGEPGIGKSRLVEWSRAEAIRSGSTVLLFQCSSYNRNTSFYPLLTQLEASLLDHPGERRLDLPAVQRHFASLEVRTEFFPYLLAGALGVSGSDEEPAALAALDADSRRRQTLRALSEYVLSYGKESPLLCVFEDLHWADPSTLELLAQLVAIAPEHPALLLATSRPGFSAPWTDLPHCRLIALPRLEGAHAATLASSIADLDGETLARVTDRAGGNPLFIEELAGALADVKERGDLGADIPATLQDSLMARLEATGIGRSVAQCGSVLGRDFTRSLLESVWDGDPGTLEPGIAAVVDAGLLYEGSDRLGERELTFKHALVRDAAYGTLLRDRRRHLHRRAAEHLLAHRAASPREASDELIAHHLYEAADLPSALRHWILAGERAAETSSYEECEAHVRRALGAIARAEDPTAFRRDELELLVLLGPALMARYGYSADAVGEVYERARSLSEHIPGTPHLTPILNGLRLYYICRSGVRKGLEVAQALLEHAERVDDDAARIEGRKAVGSTDLWTMQLEKARETLHGALSLYEMGDNMDVMRVDSDSGLTCHSFLSLVEWGLGFPERALRHSDQAAAIARASRRTFGIGEQLSFRALLLYLRRDYQSAERTAREALGLAGERGYVLWKAMSSLVLGATLTAAGSAERGLDEVRAAHRLLEEMGYLLWRPFCLAELGEGAARLGDQESAFARFDEALALSERTGEDFWRPEIFRRIATLRLHGGEEDAAREAFEQALRWAEQCGSRAWALRTATDLARHLGCRGERAAARAVLEPLYRGFEEGFDLADLREAKAVLSALA